MSAQTWGTTELGLYFLRHAGRDLEIRRVPRSGKGSAREKQYQIIIDGIFSDMAWSTPEAKTKAIKIAERTHKGEPVLSYAEREKQRGTSTNKAEAVTAKFVSTREVAEKPGGVDVIEKPTHRPAGEVRSMASVLSGLAETVQTDERHTGMTELFRTNLCAFPGKAQSGVSFTIRGNLDMDATNALNTIRAAVELLREHGGVECDVIVPSRIKL